MPTKLEDLFASPLPSSTPSNQAIIAKTKKIVKDNSAEQKKLQDTSNSNLQQLLLLNKQAANSSKKQRDFTDELANLKVADKIAAADLSKSATQQYIKTSTDQTTIDNLNAAVENRQRTQEELNALNADDGFIAGLKRGFLAPVLNQRLANQDRQINQIQNRRANSAITYAQVLVGNARAVEQNSAKEIALVTKNLELSKGLFDDYKRRGGLAKDSISAIAAQAGLTNASSEAFQKNLTVLKNENNFYTEAINAELVKLQLKQQETINSETKKSLKNDDAFYKLMQPKLDDYLERSDRTDLKGKLTAKQLFTTAKKANSPIYTQFIRDQASGQSSDIAPFSSYINKVNNNTIDPTDSVAGAVKAEADAVVKAFNNSEQAKVDAAALLGKSYTPQIISTTDPRTFAKIDELVLANREKANIAANDAFQQRLLAIPELSAFMKNPDPSVKEEISKVFAKDPELLAYIESGKMNEIPTSVSNAPDSNIESTIKAVVASYKGIAQQDALSDINTRAKVLSRYYDYSRKALAANNLQGLKALRIRGVDSFVAGSSKLSDARAFDITSEGEWVIRLKRAYIQQVKLDKLQVKLNNEIRYRN